MLMVLLAALCDLNLLSKERAVMVQHRTSLMIHLLHFGIEGLVPEARLEPSDSLFGEQVSSVYYSIVTIINLCLNIGCWP